MANKKEMKLPELLTNAMLTHFEKGVTELKLSLHDEIEDVEGEHGKKCWPVLMPSGEVKIVCVRTGV
jgi:hypothetical protein